MRQIKFRAWDREKKTMSQWDEIAVTPEWDESSYEGDFLGNGQKISMLADAWDSLENRRILMQFTGLLDKNGKEIYESDIVKNTHHTVEVKFGQGGEGEPADYVGGYFGWCFGEGDTTGGGLEWGNKWEIIGNIWETPDLLNPLP